MKEKILYAFEGFVIGLIGTHPWQDLAFSIVVAAVCAVVTLVIQFFGKRFLNSLYDKKLPKWKQNRKQ